MTKFKKLCFVLLSGAAALGVCVAIATAQKLGKNTFAEDCAHTHGYHYAKNEQSCDAAGNKEFWACCDCHQQWLSNPGGNFEDKTLTSQLPTNHIAYIAPHHFVSNDTCKDCSKSIKEVYGLSTLLDEDNRDIVTLSNFNIADQQIVNMSDGHIFGAYDFKNNGSFDLTLKFTYSDTEDNALNLFYLFNGQNEEGIILRVGQERTENDGIIYAYLFTNNSFSGDIVNGGAGTAGTGFYFPRKSGIKSGQDNYLRIIADVTDASTNSYRLAFLAGSSKDKMCSITTNPEDTVNDINYFNVTLGANYFDDGAHNYLRISHGPGTTTGTITSNIYSCQSLVSYDKRVIVYRDATNNNIARKEYAANEEIILPEIEKEGYKFLGWYDANGNKVDNNIVNGKYYIAPRFTTVANANNVTLSTFSSTTSVTYDTTTPGESYYFNTDMSSDTKRMDMSFMYTPITSNADCWATFGFPYDFVDEQTRLNFRMNLNGGTSSIPFAGYIFGKKTSLGDAGASGTYFGDGNFQILSGKAYLLTLSFIECEEESYQAFVSIQDLATGKYTQSDVKEFCYSEDLFTFDNANRNKFAFVGVYTDGAVSIATAW